MPRVTVTNNEPSTKNNELYPPILLPSTTPSYLTKQQTPSLTLSGSLTRAPSTKRPACLVPSTIVNYSLVPFCFYPFAQLIGLRFWRSWKGKGGIGLLWYLCGILLGFGMVGRRENETVKFDLNLPTGVLQNP